MADGIGAVGVFLLLVAFFLNLFDFVGRTSRSYQLLNVVGAGFACWAAVLIDFVQFVVLEGTWSMVAAFALLRPPRTPAGA